MVFSLHGLQVPRDETGSNHAWIGEKYANYPDSCPNIILSNTKAGRGAFNHIFLPNIGVGACALSALAYFVYDNLFICIDLWSYI
jgi:hypothetical protein